MALGWIGSLISGVVSPVTNHFTKKNEGKTKEKLAQIDRLKNSEDAESELDKIIAENANGWKDEYVTIIITLPVPVLFLSVIYSVATGDPTVADAAKEGVVALKELLPDYNNLLYVVCLAAIGIRAFKK